MDPEVAAAIARRDAAALERLWDEVATNLDRVAIAHALADLQPEPADELRWDLRALAAAEHLDDPMLAPSLHLNAGESYRKVGDVQAARTHLALGRAALATLGEDPYGGMLTDAFDRLEQRLSAGPP